MSRYFLRSLFLSFYVCVAWSAQVPQLIDLELAGSKDAAYFSPDSITLQEGQSYLFVMTNPFDYPYRFISEKFSEAITTQYIQGSPAVTKNSITVSAHSKVQWLFRAKKAGYFEYYAGSYDHKKMQQRQGHLHILSNNPSPAPKPSEQAKQALNQEMAPSSTEFLPKPQKPSWRPTLRGGRPS